MNRTYLAAVFMLSSCVLGAYAQPPGNNKASTGRYQYQFGVNSLDSAAVKMNNGNLKKIENHNKRGLGMAILAGLGSSFVQKTVNASSNLIDLGLSYVTDAMKKPSQNFSNWHQAMSNQCKSIDSIRTDNQIDDFYYLPSNNGALDPRNMKFDGFTCRNYIALDDGKKDDKKDGPQHSQEPVLGHDAFYVSCKLRTDSLGINHMANHSKFLLAVDSLAFFPNYCNLRNDSTDKTGVHRIYDKRKDLKFQMKVKLYSSWVNEAIMYTTNQLLGEFTINADIKKEALTLQGRDSVFIFNGKDALTRGLVSISGESFLVPRSFVGTINEPLWGTGQYRLEIEVIECCQPNPDYYLDAERVKKYQEQQRRKQEKKLAKANKNDSTEKVRDITNEEKGDNEGRIIEIMQTGNGEAVNYANLMGNRKYLKDVWKTEWRRIKERRAGVSFWKNAWDQIKVAYFGNSWVQELVSPVKTVLLQEETTQLQNLFDFTQLPTANAAAGGSSVMGGMSVGQAGATQQPGEQGTAGGAGAPAPGNQPGGKPDNNPMH